MPVRFPRRLNTDVDISVIDADESSIIHNIMPRRLPSEVRPRNGSTFIADFMQATNSAGAVLDNVDSSVTVYNAFVDASGKYMVISLVRQSSPGSDPKWAWYDTQTQSDYNRDSAGDTGYAGTNPTAPYADYHGYVIVDLEDDSGTAPGTFYGSQWDNITGNAPKFWGNPVYYDGATLVVEADRLNQYTKLYDGSVNGRRYQRNGRCVWAWAGALDLSGSYPKLFDRGTVTKDVTFTNGSGTGAVSVNWGGSANAYRNWMVRMEPVTITAGAGSTNPAFQFQYIIATNTTTTGFTITRPYGVGEPVGDVPNITTLTHSVDCIQDLWNAPQGISCIALFRDRIFGGRGFISDVATTGSPQSVPLPYKDFAGHYENAIVWSKPGNWNRWPAENFALVGEDGKHNHITAFAALADGLLVFKPTSVYLLTGYDEDSFQVQQISQVVGCPYPGSVVTYENSAFFCNRKGIYQYSMDGGLRRIDATDGGHGISEAWGSYFANRDPYKDGDVGTWHSMAVTPDGHLLVVPKHAYYTAPYPDGYVYDIINKTWASWSIGDKLQRVVSSPNGKVYAISDMKVTDITDVFNPDATSANPTDAVSTTNTAGDVFNAYIDVQFRPAPGHTVRLREMQVNHRCNYRGGTPPLDMKCWDISVARDPLIRHTGVSVTGEAAIYAKQIEAVDSEGPIPARAPAYFSDRIVSSNFWQGDGQMIRVLFTSNLGETTDDTGVANRRPQDWTLTGLYIVADVTRALGVDNTTT